MPRGGMRFALCFLPWVLTRRVALGEEPPHCSCGSWGSWGCTQGLFPRPWPASPAPLGVCVGVCTVAVPLHPAQSRHVCAAAPGRERVGLKGSLFPRVIIPEQRNRNVLKTPRRTFLTGAGPFGCTVAPLFPSLSLEQPEHLPHPPLTQNKQPGIKKQVFSFQ